MEITKHGSRYYSENTGSMCCPECNSNTNFCEFIEDHIGRRNGAQFTCDGCGCVWRYIREEEED